MLRALGRVRDRRPEDADPVPQALLATDQWRNGETCRDLVEDKEWLKQLALPGTRTGGRRRRGRDGRAHKRSRCPGASSTKVIGAAAPNGAAPVKRAAPRAQGGGGAAPPASSSRRSRAPS